MHPSFKRIALILPLGEAGDRLFHGICSYARPRLPWIFMRPARDQEPATAMRDWPADAGIGDADKRDSAQMIRDLGIPFVNLSADHSVSDSPLVLTDEAAVGRMAAEHLLSLGFEHFACIGFEDELNAVARQDSFIQELARVGRVPDVFRHKLDYPDPGTDVPFPMALISAIRRWICQLPKPVAVFATADIIAFWIAEACLMSDLLVPDDMAILGVGDESRSCLGAYPPLSSIRLNMNKIGREAARLLDAEMTEDSVTKDVIKIAPERVIVRQSTDIIAVRDPDLCRAVRFIREHAIDPIAVADVVRVVPLSRRLLERRFREELRRSVHEEIRRVQLEHAKDLLRDSSRTLDSIAQECGLRRGVYLSTVFRNTFGHTPGEYRASYRA